MRTNRRVGNQRVHNKGEVEVTERHLPLKRQGFLILAALCL